MGLKQQQGLEDRYMMHTFARKHVELVQGKGMMLYDDEGKEYLDFIAGIGVVSLGHCHPAVVDALTSQAQRLIHVGNYYFIENRGEVAHMISDLLGGEGTTWESFFANSGAEANECAVKLARRYSKKKGRDAQVIITLDKSFHGRTLATLAATAQPAKQEAFQPLPGGFVHTPINDIAALEALFEQLGDTVCAVMIECVQGESGVHPCTDEFIFAVERLAHDNGALFICDEIQTGIYRCGSTPFAYQHFGVEPDIVTIAKGVASGFPVGVCAAKSDVARAFEPGDHGSTFGGSCLAIAAIQATLATLASDDIIGSIEPNGVYLRTLLAGLPHVVEVRGLGLMCACDLDDSVKASDIVDRSLEAGLLINATGPQTLRFLPPLVCTEADIEELVGKLGAVLGSQGTS